MEQARRHRTESETLTSALRELTAKVHAGRATQQEAERQALLDEGSLARGALSEGGGGVSARSNKAAAKDATESLRRTRQIMADELQRADNTLRTLDAQGSSLKHTLQEQRGVGSSLDSGRRSLARLRRREFTDKVRSPRSLRLGARPNSDR